MKIVRYAFLFVAVFCVAFGPSAVKAAEYKWKLGHEEVPGGYYDRFLPRAAHATRLALTYSCQLTENVPVDVLDCRVDFILTENEWISCKW